MGRFPSYQKEQWRGVGRQVSYSGLLLFTDSGWWQSDLVENYCTIQLLSRLMRLFRGAPAQTSPQTQRQILMKREPDIKNTKPQACHNRGRTASALDCCLGGAVQSLGTDSCVSFMPSSCSAINCLPIYRSDLFP